MKKYDTDDLRCQITAFEALIRYLQNFSWHNSRTDQDEKVTLSLHFTPCLETLAHATSIYESLFLAHLLHMWKDRSKIDGKRVYKRKPGLGLYLSPARFCQRTALSRRQFYKFVEKYERLDILRSELVVAEGNRKYYTLDEEQLEKYLFESMCNAEKKVVRKVVPIKEKKAKRGA